jgi:hypothetical protein
MAEKLYNTKFIVANMIEIVANDNQICKVAFNFLKNNVLE